ncbi:PEGA domain-containing protein [Polyangium sp. 15x6]|uniref:PEGA domain-containing protein n=1 Tax=Polyangium sp. 15x6 TaxID=3042687 RepID=UPI002499D664|nr:PEGA domain-containing protein [Polyangium sp. 15x6]MDI3284238.1 PEGA domain-containing protein [Polyangium sp. 15x6]
MKRTFGVAVLLGASLVHALPVLAQSQPPAAPSSVLDEVPEPTKEDKEEAYRQFKRGVELMGEKAYAPALAAFQRSRELYAGKSATKNIAACMREMQRYDEAVDAYEQLLRFPNLTASDKLEAQQYIAEMRARVGTIEIEGAELGAVITIDGQVKGEFPPPNPLRTAAGSHVVRVYKEDFEPFEDRVEVNGGETRRLTAKLRPLKDSGRIRVVELSGRALDVYVDGARSGKTPWEARVGVGRHVVQLGGAGTLGTQPAAVVIKPQETQLLSLRAENLDAAIRVEPTPPDARVAIDGVEVGAGVWFGRLKSGNHLVEIYQEGYVKYSKEWSLEPGTRPLVNPVLKRDTGAQRWAKWAFEFDSGLVAATPSLGGDVLETSCGDGCSPSAGLGTLSRLMVSYEWGFGLGVGPEVGYLASWQSVEGRKVVILPKGFDSQVGVGKDTLRLTGVTLGVSGSYRFGSERVPVGIRVGGGVLIGQIRDDRDARDFTSTQAGIGNVSNVSMTPELVKAYFAYFRPEFYAGLRLGKHFEIGADMSLLMLFSLGQPRFDDTQPVTVSLSVEDNGVARTSRSYATFPNEALTGQVIFSVVPGLRARYDF